MVPTSLVRRLVFVIPSSDNVFQYTGRKRRESTTISIVYFSDMRTRQGQSDAMGGGVTDEGEGIAHSVGLCQAELFTL